MISLDVLLNLAESGKKEKKQNIINIFYLVKVSNK